MHNVNGDALTLRHNRVENLSNVRITRHSMDCMTAENEPAKHD